MAIAIGGVLLFFVIYALWQDKNKTCGSAKVNTAVVQAVGKGSLPDGVVAYERGMDISKYNNVIVHATWCPHCVNLIKALENGSKRAASSTVQILLVESKDFESTKLGYNVEYFPAAFSKGKSAKMSKLIV